MDYNAPPSSSAAGDSRQKTYKVDAAVEHARNKLETRIQAGLAQGLEICEIEITKQHVPELTQPLKKYRAYKTQRGMNKLVDIRDWLGGWPMEFVGDKDTVFYLEKLGFELVKIKTGEANTEFLFRKL